MGVQNRILSNFCCKSWMKFKANVQLDAKKENKTTWSPQQNLNLYNRNNRSAEFTKTAILTETHSGTLYLTVTVHSNSLLYSLNAFLQYVFKVNLTNRPNQINVRFTSSTSLLFTIFRTSELTETSKQELPKQAHVSPSLLLGSSSCS